MTIHSEFSCLGSIVCGMHLYDMKEEAGWCVKVTEYAHMCGLRT